MKCTILVLLWSNEARRRNMRKYKGKIRRARKPYCCNWTCPTCGARFPWTSKWSVRRDPLHHGERVRRIYSFPWCPCEEGGKQTDHQCLQEAHPHRPLPPLLLTPPPELPCQMKRSMSRMSWWQMATRRSSCREAEKEARCFSERPTKGQIAPAIHQGCQ